MSLPADREAFMRMMGITTDDVADPDMLPSRTARAKGKLTSGGGNSSISGGVGVGSSLTSSIGLSMSDLATTSRSAAGGVTTTVTTTSAVSSGGASRGGGLYSPSSNVSSSIPTTMSSSPVAAAVPSPGYTAGASSASSQAQRRAFLADLGLDDAALAPPPSAGVPPLSSTNSTSGRLSLHGTHQSTSHGTFDEASRLLRQQGSTSFPYHTDESNLTAIPSGAGGRPAGTSSLSCAFGGNHPKGISTTAFTSSCTTPLDDSSPEGLKFAGNAAFERGEFVEAIRHYTAAMDAVQNGARSSTLPAHEHSRAAGQQPTPLLMAALYSNRSASYLQGAKQLSSLEDAYEHALYDADMAVSLRPDWFKGYSRQGDVHFKTLRYHQAAEAFEMALRLEPGNLSLSRSLKESKERAKQESREQWQQRRAARGRGSSTNISSSAISPTTSNVSCGNQLGASTAGSHQSGMGNAIGSPVGNELNASGVGFMSAGSNASTLRASVGGSDQYLPPEAVPAWNGAGSSTSPQFAAFHTTDLHNSGTMMSNDNDTDGATTTMPSSTTAAEAVAARREMDSGVMRSRRANSLCTTHSTSSAAAATGESREMWQRLKTEMETTNHAPTGDDYRRQQLEQFRMQKEGKASRTHRAGGFTARSSVAGASTCQTSTTNSLSASTTAVNATTTDLSGVSERCKTESPPRPSFLMPPRPQSLVGGAGFGRGSQGATTTTTTSNSDNQSRDATMSTATLVGSYVGKSALENEDTLPNASVSRVTKPPSVTTDSASHLKSMDIPFEYSSTAATAYQQRLLEEFRRKKEKK